MIASAPCSAAQMGQSASGSAPLNDKYDGAPATDEKYELTKSKGDKLNTSNGLATS
jgi:hypothetical protein